MIKLVGFNISGIPNKVYHIRLANKRGTEKGKNNGMPMIGVYSPGPPFGPR